MSDDTQVADAGTETDTSTEAGGSEESAGGGDSISRLTERLDKFIDQMERSGEREGQSRGGLLDSVQRNDDDLDDDEYAEDLDDDLDGDDYATDEQAQARRLLEEFVDSRLQERIQPYLQEQYEEKRIEQVQALEQKYPELATPDKAQPLVEMAEQLARTLGEPGLAYEAPFLETIYLRMKAEQVQADERSAGDDREASVESGGAASPRNAGNKTDLADEIVKAGRPKSIFG